MISGVLWYEKVKNYIDGLTGVEKRYGFSIFFVCENQLVVQGTVHIQRFAKLVCGYFVRVQLSRDFYCFFA